MTYINDVMGISMEIIIRYIKSLLDDLYIKEIAGYCSNCGDICKHNIEDNDLKLKTKLLMSILNPLAIFSGLPFTKLFSVRAIYICSNCGVKTLPCRNPLCSGMSLVGDYWDNELCGKCFSGSDNSILYKAKSDQKTIDKLKIIILICENKIDSLRKDIDELIANKYEGVELNEKVKHAKNIESSTEYLNQLLKSMEQNING